MFQVMIGSAKVLDIPFQQYTLQYFYLHVVIKMADHAEISCALVGQPIFTEDYIITEHKVSFQSRDLV